MAIKATGRARSIVLRFNSFLGVSIAQLCASNFDFGEVLTGF